MNENGSYRPQPGEAMRFEALGKCPCGQDIAINMEYCGVAHAKPTCEAYDELEPEAFLAYVRMSRCVDPP